MDARPKDGKRHLGWSAMRHLIVGSLENVLCFLELAQIDERGGQREQRLDMASIGGEPAAVACSVAEQFEPFGDLALVPGDDRTGDQGRRDGMAIVLTGDGKDSFGHGSADLVVQPGKSLQLRGQRPVSHVLGQPRLRQYHPGLGVGVAGLPSGAKDR
jgi:hypothetical protein